MKKIYLWLRESQSCKWLDAGGNVLKKELCACFVLTLFPWYLPVAAALDFCLGVVFQSIYYIN